MKWTTTDMIPMSRFETQHCENNIEVGQLLVVGCWLLVVSCWLLVVSCWLLVVETLSSKPMLFAAWDVPTLQATWAFALGRPTTNN
jgi:hypothetical protein